MSDQTVTPLTPEQQEILNSIPVASPAISLVSVQSAEARAAKLQADLDSLRVDQYKHQRAYYARNKEAILSKAKAKRSEIKAAGGDPYAPQKAYYHRRRQGRLPSVCPPEGLLPPPPAREAPVSEERLFVGVPPAREHHYQINPPPFEYARHSPVNSQDATGETNRFLSHKAAKRDCSKRRYQQMKEAKARGMR
jgi:hypothetical protein